MKYKGYTAKLGFDKEALVMYGEVIGINDVLSFEASELKDVEKAFQDCIDSYLEFCQSIGKRPEKPLSGKFIVRCDPYLHRQITNTAAAQGQALNQWVVDVLSERIKIEDEESVPVTVE